MYMRWQSSLITCNIFKVIFAAIRFYLLTRLPHSSLASFFTFNKPPPTPATPNRQSALTHLPFLPLPSWASPSQSFPQNSSLISRKIRIVCITSIFLFLSGSYISLFSRQEGASAMVHPLVFYPTIFHPLLFLHSGTKAFAKTVHLAISIKSNSVGFTSSSFPLVILENLQTMYSMYSTRTRTAQ